ncbi:MULTISPECIES: type VI toxin-antitoxin system SocB family DNA replication inhibitor toxin [Sphingomonas]|uniref:Uncharacterized protein n=1 Tax=Sphingomonas molluscorum TaxID=418184 RepID=A0ABU8Q187_9SPHN|nr:hypothetical protein [Sphingomonas sp. JUb134]MBM7405003.1 hypothetical protein [Sphingomonas sp. JUb134]
MKLRRLPETDLARIAPLAADEKRKALKSFTSGGGSWSYDPARAQNFNIVNPVSPLGLLSKRPSMEAIRKLIANRCTCDAQEDSCLEVVDLFEEWYRRNATGAVERAIPSMAIGSLGLVRYWENFFARVRDQNTFLFIDYRRQKGLTKAARKFVFSMMHQQIRVSDPDLHDASLLILQFPQWKSGRSIVDHALLDDDLYSPSELSKMIDETYAIWLDILSERKTAEPVKRVAGGFF